MKLFSKFSMTTLLLALSSNWALAAREPIPPFGSQTADWVVPIVFVAIVIFFIWKSTGGGRGGGSDGNKNSNHWGVGD